MRSAAKRANGVRANRCASYDPNDPRNVEDRINDRADDGIDWDEIILSTQDEVEAGEFSFNSDDYPTHEAAMEGLKAFLHSITEEVLREIAAEAAHNNTSTPGHPQASTICRPTAERSSG